MKRTMGCLLVVLVLLPGLALGAVPRFEGWEIAEVGNQPLAEGLVLWEYTLIRQDELGQAVGQRLHVLEYDQRLNAALTPRLVSRGMQIHGLQTLGESMAELQEAEPGLKVLAGINGDFFDTSAGGSLGLAIAEGRLMMSSEFPGSFVLAFDPSGAPRIGRPELTLQFSASRKGEAVIDWTDIPALNGLRSDVAPGRSSPANAFRARQDNDLVLYTADWYRSTMQPDGGYEIAFSAGDALKPQGQWQGAVTRIYGQSKVTLAGEADVPQGMPLGDKTMVLSATGESIPLLRRIRKGDDIHIRTAISEGWKDIALAMGGGRPDGGPLLVWQGQPQPDGTGLDDYVYFYGAHARTAVGIREDDSSFFLTCDGYRPGEAEGLTIAELRQVMLDLGAHQALNLDGGPSSTMIVRQGGGLSLLSDSRRGRTRESRVGNVLVFCEALVP